MVNANGSTPGSSGVSSSSGSGGGSGAIPATMPPQGFRNAVALLVRGIGIEVPDGSTIRVAGQSVSKASLLEGFTALLALYAGVDAGVRSLKSERLALEAALPDAHQFVVGVRDGLIAEFGRGNPVLAAFGLEEHKAHPLTSEQKTARAAKALRTRELRGTGGKRQKVGVKFKGQLEVQTVVASVPASEVAAPSTPGAK